MPQDTSWVKDFLAEPSLSFEQKRNGLLSNGLDPAAFGLAAPAPQAPAGPISMASPLAPQAPAPQAQPAPAQAPPQVQAPQPPAQSAQSRVAPAQPLGSFKATLADGTEVKGPDFGQWLDTHKQNPKAPEIAKLNVEGEQAQSMANWMTANAPPQQQQIDGGDMPTLAHTQMPGPSKAHLNPLAVALGMAAGMGQGYGPGSAAALGQVAVNAVSQTHADFQQKAQQAQMMAEEAAAQYHAQMEQRNQAIREQAENGAIDFGNANRAWTNRKNAQGLSIDANADTSLSGKLTAIGQQQNDIDAVEQQRNRAAAEPKRYLDQLKEAQGVDTGNAQIAHTNAETAGLVQTQEEDAQKFPLVLGKLKVDIKTGQANLDEAAAKLGVTKEQLKQAMIKTGFAKASGQAAIDKLQAEIQQVRQGTADKHAKTNSDIQLETARTNSTIALNRSTMAKNDASTRKTLQDIANDANGGQIDPDDAAIYLKMNDGLLKPLSDARDTAQQQLTAAQANVNKFETEMGGAKPGNPGSGYSKAQWSNLQTQLRQATANFQTADSAFRQGQQRHDGIQQSITAKTKGGVFGGSGQAPAAQQRLSPAQAAALPSGTHFIGTDGVERVKH